MTRATLFLSACLWLAPCAAIAASPPTPTVASTTANITVDDFLKAEDLGAAWFSPDGKRVMLTRGLPAEEAKEHGQANESIVRNRVMIADLASGAPTQIGNFAPIPGMPWSPDGSHALMLWVKDGAYGLAYWNAASGTSTVLPGRVGSTYPAFAWSGDRLFYGVIADDDIQLDARPQILQRLTQNWRDGWTGDQPQISISSTDPLFESTSPSAGKLMMADLGTGQVRQIGEGDFKSFAFQVSPDGRYLAAVRVGAPLEDSISWFGRRGELQIFDLSAGGAALVHTISNLDFSDQGFAWSPRGDHLLIGAKSLDAPRASGGIFEVDAVSGRVRRLAGEGLRFLDTSPSSGTQFLPLGWIGNKPVAIAGRAGQSGSEVPQSGARLDYGGNEGLRFDLYDLSGPKPRALTAFSRASVRSFQATAGRRDAMIVADGALWSVDPDASSVKRLTPDGFSTVLGLDAGGGSPATPGLADAAGKRVSLLVASKTGDLQRTVLDLSSGRALAGLPARSVVAASPDGMSFVTSEQDGWATTYALKTPQVERPLITVNANLRGRRIAPVRRFEFDYKGKPLTGWVLLPPDAKPGEPLPAIVSVYGGTVYGAKPPSGASSNPQGAQFSGQILAAHGYAVIYPSTPLGAGTDTDVMRTLADECIAAVDALAAQGLVDPKRVGVTGQSFGGYSTAAILAAASNRFRAGVATAGAYDWSFSYGIPWMSEMLSIDKGLTTVAMKTVEDGQIRLGGPVWTATEAYHRNSPLYHVEAISSPLLMLHGDLDLAAYGLPGATRMYNAMKRAGKDVALVHYWGEGHVSTTAWAIRDQVGRTIAWFDAYVKGEASARTVVRSGE